MCIRDRDMPADMVCEVNSNAHFKNIFECTGVNVADEIMKYIMSHWKFTQKHRFERVFDKYYIYN